MTPVGRGFRSRVFLLSRPLKHHEAGALGGTAVMDNGGSLLIFIERWTGCQQPRPCSKSPVAVPRMRSGLLFERALPRSLWAGDCIGQPSVGEGPLTGVCVVRGLASCRSHWTSRNVCTSLSHVSCGWDSSDIYVLCSAEGTGEGRVSRDFPGVPDPTACSPATHLID